VFLLVGDTPVIAMMISDGLHVPQPQNSSSIAEVLLCTQRPPRGGRLKMVCLLSASILFQVLANSYDLTLMA